MKRQTVVHEFVESAPEQLQDGILYVCIGFATVIHKCCCGCGNEVVTPLSPTDWKLTFDGETITLYPSIGNWGFACRSHYWIRNNSVQWAGEMSLKDIEAGRAYDRFAKDRQFGTLPAAENLSEPPAKRPAAKSPKGFWQKIKKRRSPRRSKE
jgi:Family of unknown function (DUF6527)